MNDAPIDIFSEKLSQKGNLLSLLYDKSADCLSSCDFIIDAWERIPYYPQKNRLRTAYHIKIKEKQYLIKINIETERIYREGTACKILHPKNNPPYISVPKILGFNSNITLDNGLSCGWIITEWKKGLSDKRIKDNDLLDLLPKGLLHLHSIPVSEKEFEQIFCAKLPTMESGLEILHQRRIAFIDEALRICKKTFLPDFKRIRKILNSQRSIKSYSFIHGDLHINNIKLIHDDDLDRFSLLLFDWEAISVEHPIMDLANMIVAEDFSKRSFKCLDKYLEMFNKERTENEIISYKDVWIGIAICFIRNFVWQIQSGNTDNGKFDFNAVEKKLEIILATLESNNLKYT
jgi:thiamine kinase-like enzyme